jgi:hypothetical protein
MIFKLVHQIQDDLITSVGPNSSYGDDKVENIYIDPPKSPSDNVFIGIQETNKIDSDYEIGKKIATVFTYSINLVIAVNHSDKFAAKELLEKIERRVIKSFNTSNITTVSDTTDDIIERVLDFSLKTTNYNPGEYPDNNLIHHIIMTLEVRTQLEL